MHSTCQIFFIDNTVDHFTKDHLTNKDWVINEHLSRLLKIVTHSELVRPTAAETAMHHAFAAKMQSACLSRQVGAALTDRDGNLLATGTNEVPKAGGGVYGEAFARDSFEGRCGIHDNATERYCHNTNKQYEIIHGLIEAVRELRTASAERKRELAVELRSTDIGALLEFSRAVHAEMDALLTAARNGISTVGTRLFVTTYPCHYCARHIVTAGVDEVQYIEPYPKSQAVSLHVDSIEVENAAWIPPSSPNESENRKGKKVLFHPFSGVAPRLYRRAFVKDRQLKDGSTGQIRVQPPLWGTPWHLGKLGYPDMELHLAKDSSNEE